jgi:hypothetical protein
MGSGWAARGTLSERVRCSCRHEVLVSEKGSLAMATEHGEPGGSQPVVLVVDDDPIVRRLVRRSLEALGCRLLALLEARFDFARGEANP